MTSTETTASELRGCTTWCNDAEDATTASSHECMTYADSWQVLASWNPHAFGDGHGYLCEGGRIPHASVVLRASHDDRVQGPLVDLTVAYGGPSHTVSLTLREAKALAAVLTDAVSRGQGL